MGALLQPFISKNTLIFLYISKKDDDKAMTEEVILATFLRGLIPHAFYGKVTVGLCATNIHVTTL